MSKVIFRVVFNILVKRLLIVAGLQAVLRRVSQLVKPETRLIINSYSYARISANRTYGTTNIQRWKHGLLLLRVVLFAAGRMKFV